MKRVLSVFGVGLVAASTVAAVVAAPSATATPVSAAASVPGRYVALTPQRALDSRTNGGAFGQGETRSLDLSGRVPSSATAVVLNLTATAPTQPGYLTVWPTGSPQPLASSLNKKAGETRSNSVTIALPGGSNARSVNIFNQAGSTQVVVDLLGYYDTNSGTSYYPIFDPFRAFDSRDPNQSGGGVFAPGDSVTIPLTTNISGTSALALNITAVSPDGPGYLTGWNGETDQPTVSNVNYEPGRVTPNFAIVPVTVVSDDLVTFTIGNNVSDTDIVVDVVGGYATSGQASNSTSYVSVPPQRLSDTRDTGALGPNAVYDTSVPGGADYYSANLNITAVNPSDSTYLTAYASDRDKPEVSNLNVAPGDVVPNAAQPLLSIPGQYRVYNASGYVNVVADLEGYFVGDSSGKADGKAAVRTADVVTTSSVAAVRH